MKRLTAFAFACILALGACSPSDDDDNPGPVTADTQYLPMDTGNYWVYDVSGSDFAAGRDSLYVANDTVINGKTYQNLNTKKPAIGFYSASATQSGARIDGDKIVISGTAGLNFTEQLPVQIDLVDFVVFKESAVLNDVLDSESGTLQQEFNGIPLTITYTLKTICGESQSSMEVNGQVFQDIKSVYTHLTLKITTSVGGFPISVLNTQDVVISKQHYAKGIGVVSTVTTVSYNLEDLGVPLGIPQSYTQSSLEKLDIYVAD